MVCRIPPHNLTDAEIRAIDNFWGKISMYYEHIREAIFKHDKTTLMLHSINSFLEALGAHVEIAMTYGEKNRQAMWPYEELLELYVSPKLNHCALPLMDALVFRAPKLSGLSVARYRPYHERDSCVQELRYPGGHVIRSEDLQFRITHGYRRRSAHCIREDDLRPEDDVYYPVLHLSIFVADPVASWLLETSTVQFRGTHDDIVTAITGANGRAINSKRDVLTERRVYAGCIFSFLVSAVGEYNVVNHIGNIELHRQSEVETEAVADDAENIDNNAASDHADQLTTSGSDIVHAADLVDIYALKEEITLLLASYDYHSCAYCSSHELQQDLKRCSACHSTWYCGRECQRADYTTHKYVCKQRAQEYAQEYLDARDSDVVRAVEPQAFENLAEQLMNIDQVHS